MHMAFRQAWDRNFRVSLPLARRTFSASTGCWRAEKLCKISCRCRAMERRFTVQSPFQEVSMMSPEEFIRRGEAPSHRFGSTYTEICNLLTQIDNFPIRRSNYYIPGEVRLIIKLKAKIDD